MPSKERREWPLMGVHESRREGDEKGDEGCTKDEIVSGVEEINDDRGEGEGD